MRLQPRHPSLFAAAAAVAAVAKCLWEQHSLLAAFTTSVIMSIKSLPSAAAVCAGQLPHLCCRPLPLLAPSQKGTC